MNVNDRGKTVAKGALTRINGVVTGVMARKSLCEAASRSHKLVQISLQWLS